MRALESSLSRPYQVAFRADQEAGNEFTMPGDQLNDRFLVLTKVAFWDYQVAEN